MRQFYVGTLSLGFPPRVADLRVQASLEQRQQFQQLFFPDGIAFDGKRFGGTRVTAPAFSYLQPIVDGNERLVDQNSASWNPLIRWLRKSSGCMWSVPSLLLETANEAHG